MRKKVKRVTVVSSGIMLCSIGTAGLILPIIPGLALILLGIYILSVSLPKFKSKIMPLASKIPSFDRFVEIADKKIKKYID